MEFPYKTIIEFSLASMPCSSRRKPFGKFKDFPIHKFVELVETNPDVTPAFGLPRGFARFDVSTSSTGWSLSLSKGVAKSKDFATGTEPACL